MQLVTLNMKYVSEIITILAEDKSKLPLLILLFVLSSFLDLLGIGLFGWFVSLILDPSQSLGPNDAAQKLLEQFGIDKSLTEYVGAILIFVFGLKAVTALIVQRNILRFCFKQQVHLQSSLMNRYQQMPYREYLIRNSAEYITNIQVFSRTFSIGVLLPTVRAISDVIVAIAIFIFLAFTSITMLTACILILGGAAFTYDRVFKKHLKRLGESANHGAVEMVRAIKESIDGFRDFRILGAQTFMFKRMKANAELYAHNIAKQQLITIAPKYFFEVLLVLLLVTPIAAVDLLDVTAVELLPTLAIFGFASIRLLPVTNSVTTSLTQLRFNRNAVRRLHQDLNNLPLNQSNTYSSHLLKGVEPFSKLAIDEISYQYHATEDSVFERLSFEIARGQSIGIVGASGSGKSTLIGLVLGLLQPTKGSIFMNGKELESVLGNWWSQIAYIPQEVFLIDSTLKENIGLGVNVDDLDSERIDRAIYKARLSEFVKSLPDGVDSLVGDRGMAISGGQRQRVAIARAFYHERDILVLDEATSSLDADTEAQIVDEIEMLKGEKTLIMVSHQPAALRHCDAVFRLHNGQLVPD